MLAIHDELQKRFGATGKIEDFVNGFIATAIVSYLFILYPMQKLYKKQENCFTGTISDLFLGSKQCTLNVLSCGQANTM